MQHRIGLHLLLAIALLSACVTTKASPTIYPAPEEIYVGVREKLIFDPGPEWKVEEKASFRNADAYRAIRYVRTIESGGVPSGESLVTLAYTKAMPLSAYPEQIRKTEERVCPTSALKLDVVSQDERSIVIKTVKTPCAVPYKTDRMLSPEHQFVRIIDGEAERFELRYTTPESLMTPASKDYWITKLMSATLTRK